MNSRPQACLVSQSPPCDVSLPCRRNFRTLFSCAAHSSKFRILFQVAYTLSPLPATLTKTAGVYTNNSRSGTHLPVNHSSFISLACANQDSQPICFCAPPAMRPSIATIPLSSLAATLMDLPACVANKRLTVLLNSLDATLTKTGGGGLLVMLTKVTGGVSLPCAATGSHWERRSICPMPSHESASHISSSHVSPGCRPLARMLRFGVP